MLLFFQTIYVICNLLPFFRENDFTKKFYLDNYISDRTHTQKLDFKDSDVCWDRYFMRGVLKIVARIIYFMEGRSLSRQHIVHKRKFCIF